MLGKAGGVMQHPRAVVAPWSPSRTWGHNSRGREREEQLSRRPCESQSCASMGIKLKSQDRHVQNIASFSSTF